MANVEIMEVECMLSIHITLTFQPFLVYLPFFYLALLQSVQFSSVQSLSRVRLFVTP